MISISRLLCDTVGPGDHLRYRDRNHSTGSSMSAPSDTPRPVVVWNCTRECNLNCVHCYASAGKTRQAPEMDTGAGEAFIRDLASFGVPVIMFSGGEPLIRDDFFRLAECAADSGMRLVLSSNGTLINEAVARELRQLRFAEVGISLDGIGPTNDLFRGRQGAYEAALSGIRHCVSQGLRLSLRFTITRANYQEIPAIFQLVEKESIDRVCFYHLAYAGRGSRLQKQDIDRQQTREVMDTICEHTLDLHRRGMPREVLTVANHADGIYLYLKASESQPGRADAILNLLKANGGNSAGIRICSVDEVGEVHPDQFWRHYSLGNIGDRLFGEIWGDTSEPLLGKLRDRKSLLQGRCARCRYVDLCNGNLRVRAEAVHGDVWAEDPACYLTDEEIGLE